MAAQPARSIFISYRRSDTAQAAGRLYERLVKRFGTERVFMDVDSIGAGRDFTEVIEAKLASCAVMLALISTRWLETVDGVRRIDDPEDFVRIEIKSALQRGIPVIPVLVDGGQLPRADELPHDLTPLVRRQAETVDHATFGRDAQALIEQLEPIVTDRAVWPPRRRVLWGGGAAAIVVIAVATTLIATSGGTPGSSPPTTPTGAATSTSGPATPPGALLADTFPGVSLDPAKWQPPSRPDVIRPIGGHLLMSVRPGTSDVDVRLDPIALGRPFDDVRFTVTQLPYGKAGQGGGSFIVNGDGPKPQILAFGPSPGGPSLYPLTCEKASCTTADYGRFTQLPGPKVAFGEPIPIEVVRRDGRLRFLASNVELGSTADPGPLTTFRFTASAGPPESWDIQIDDLVVR